MSPFKRELTTMTIYPNRIEVIKKGVTVVNIKNDTTSFTTRIDSKNLAIQIAEDLGVTITDTIWGSRYKKDLSTKAKEVDRANEDHN